MKNLFINLFCFIFIFSALSANTIRVPSDYSTIQGAINFSTEGDTILVADGTYIGDGNKNILFSGRNVVVLSENGPGNCIIDCESSDLSVAFVVNSSESKFCVVEGFTVRNANIGFWIYAGSTPTIEGNVIENCGAGIYCSSEASPFIIGNIIRDNHSTGPFPQYGGGISMEWSSATVVNNLIYGNSSDRGGGIYCSNSYGAIIMNNTICSNSAIYGGSLFIDESPIEVVNNILAFSEYLPAGDLRFFSYDHMQRANYDGAKLASVDYIFSIQNRGAGGLVHFKSSSGVGGRGIDTSFQMETGERRRVYINSKVNEFGDFGGLNLDITIGNETINYQPDPNPGSYYLTMTLDPDAEPASKEIIEIGQGTVITYSDIFGNGEANYYSGNSLEEIQKNIIAGIDGNIADDPIFNNPDYSLASQSPCIDAGTNTYNFYDINGNSRPLGNGWDMGAYEYDPATSVENGNQLPKVFVLNQNYPNPFNPATTINYSIPAYSELAFSDQNSQKQHSESPLPRRGFRGGFMSVKLVVYDILGREVATLVNKRQRPGSYTISFNAEDLPSGTYIYRLTAGAFTQSRKMILLK